MKHSLLLKLTLLLFFFNVIVCSTYSQWREKHNGADDNNEINGISFISPSTGFLALNNSVAFTIDSGKTFSNKDITPANTDFNGYFVNLTFGFTVKGVHAFSADSLLAYGHYGTEPSILFSANRGSTWKIIFHRPYNFNANVFNEGITDMQFPGNGTVGFAVHNEEILKTANRGQTWVTIMSATNEQLKKLSFPSLTAGFVSGRNKIYKTTDAGTTWFPVVLPDATSGVEYDNIFFTNTTSGYVLDNAYGKIYRTINGGSTWTKMNDETLDPIGGYDLHFINDSTGFIAAEYSFTIAKTSDNGKTWEPCKRNNNYSYLGYGFNSLYFLNSQIAWCGGGHEYLEITTNGATVTHPQAYFKIDTTGLYSTGAVKLTNFSRKSYAYKWYKNNTLISTSYSASFVHNFSEQVDTIKLIVSNGIDADTSIQYQYYSVIPLPVISSFYPTLGSTGTLIELSGANLSNVTSVSFGNIPASSFQIVSDNIIDAVVANGSSGDVTVSALHGSSSIAGFIFNAPPTSLVPVISNFSPASGLIGTPVTINGSNFNSDPDKDIVMFGTVKAVVTSASTSRIVCEVPAATTYQSISVLDLSTHLSGSSLKPFNVVFGDSAVITPSSFVNAHNISYPANDGPIFVNAADVDGDGKIDLLTPELGGTNIIRAYRNISNIDAINFDSGKNICSFPGLNRGYVTMADLDGDGKPDFVNSTNASWVTITKNTSIPGFISVDKPFNAPVGGGAEMVAIGDLDNDGRPDIACADYDSRLSILRNTSNPGYISFAADSYFVINNYYTLAVAIGDFDEDGKNDVITTNQNSTISIFRNLSTRNHIVFATRIDMPAPGIGLLGEDQVFIADYDGDGKLDIVQPNGNAYMVFRNISSSGNIAFASPVSFDIFGGSNAIGNLKGYGNPDFVTGGVVSTNISTPGNISSNYTTNFPISANAQVCADINGDGKQDIVSANRSAVSIFKNQVGVPIRFNMCPYISVLIFSDIADGTISYQWQQDTGNGFKNIHDNINFQGTNTEALVFLHTPPSWNGRKYRCIVDGYRESSTFLLVMSKHISTITLTADSVCYGAANYQFTADASQNNARAIFNYVWQVNGQQIAKTKANILESSYPFQENDTLRVILNGNDECRNSISDTSKPLLIHLLQKPEKPGLITGPTKIVIGGSNEYYIAPVTNADSYTWTEPNQASNLPQTTDQPQVDVIWNNNFQNSDYICVAASNQCGTSPTSCTNSIVLPVTLVSFEAEREGNLNKLTWVTKTEINLDRYEVQRSNDGIQFYKLADIAAQKLPGKYYFDDSLPLNDNNYYRLKIVDRDGKFTYSEIKMVSNVIPLQVEIAPNPIANNILAINVGNNENTTAVLFVINRDSKIVLKRKINITNGLSHCRVNVSNLVSGAYFLEVTTSKNKIVKQFIK